MTEPLREKQVHSQQFGNAVVDHGSRLFQGIVHGDVHLGLHENRLHSLEIASGATFNATNKQNSPSCLENTRIDLLQQIETWAESHVQKRMYWLKGMAGTGKSTISLTIARKYAREGRLGASFFFSRGSGDSASARKFVPTIIAQLVETVPGLQRYIERALESNRHILDLGIYNQWEKLLLEPFTQLSTESLKRTIVVVIDALDECDDENDIALLVKCLEVATTMAHTPLRVFVTSRPELFIKYAFDGISKESHQDFILHNIEDSIVDHDLEIFYNDRLGRTAQLFHLDAALYSNEMIQFLVQRSHRLFIHAATVCRFVHEGKGLAGKNLTLLIAEADKPHKAERDLDQIYTTVLTHSWSPATQLDPQEAAELNTRFSHIVGSIVVLFDVVNVGDLAAILNKPLDETRRVLQSFHSVLDVPDEDCDPIRLLHPSFRDFLLDPARCQVNTFAVNSQEVHGYLFRNCLGLLKIHLKRNMCQLEHPGTRVHEITKAIVDRLLPRAAQYACRYWIHHLLQSDFNESVRCELEDFINTHFIYWLESLSLLRQVSEGLAMLRLLWAKLSNPSLLSSPALLTTSTSWLSRLRKKEKQETIQLPPLSATIYDAMRFLLDHASIIAEAPLQIYCSALVFSPETSIIRKLYARQIPAWIVRQPIPYQDWNQSLQTLIHSNQFGVHAIAFSPNNKLIASGSQDGTIRIWEAFTGMERTTFQEPSKSYLKAIGFSPNNRLIVSGSYSGAVRIWSAETGREQLAIQTPLEGLKAVAFSPDGQSVAAAVHRKTVFLWDSSTGQEKFTVKENLHWIKVMASKSNSYVGVAGSNGITNIQQLWGRFPWPDWNRTDQNVVFSTDLRMAAVVEVERADPPVVWSHEIKLWDISRWAKPIHKHTFSKEKTEAISIAFSPNGEMLVSGSITGNITIWNTVTGRKVRTLSGLTDSILSLAFSSDGQLASGSDDGTVRLWDMVNGREIGTSGGRTQMVRIITFSTDSRTVAWVTESSETDVQLWYATESYELRTLKGAPGFGIVKCVTFSSDNQYIAVASAHGDALWDLKTGEIRRSSRTRHGLHVAFSPDSRLVAFRHSHKTDVWDIATGKTRHELSQRLSAGDKSDAGPLVAFSPDSRFMAFGTVYGVTLFDTITGTERQDTGVLENGASPIEVVYSPNGQFIAAPRDTGGTTMLDAATGMSRRTIDEMVGKVAFSPDSRLVLSQPRSKRSTEPSCLWDVATGEKLHSFHCSGSMDAVAFLPDSQRIVWSAPDKTMRTWDMTTRCESCTCSNVHPRWNLSCSPCGKHIITDRGTLVLPSAASEPSSLLALEDWLQKDGLDLIFVHVDHRGNLLHVSGDSIIFNNGPDSILQIDTSCSFKID